MSHWDSGMFHLTTKIIAASAKNLPETVLTVGALVVGSNYFQYYFLKSSFKPLSLPSSIARLTKIRHSAAAVICQTAGPGSVSPFRSQNYSLKKASLCGISIAFAVHRLAAHRLLRAGRDTSR